MWFKHLTNLWIAMRDQAELVNLLFYLLLRLATANWIKIHWSYLILALCMAFPKLSTIMIINWIKITDINPCIKFTKLLLWWPLSTVGHMHTARHHNYVLRCCMSSLLARRSLQDVAGVVERHSTNPVLLFSTQIYSWWYQFFDKVQLQIWPLVTFKVFFLVKI